MQRVSSTSYTRANSAHTHRRKDGKTVTENICNGKLYLWEKNLCQYRKFLHEMAWDRNGASAIIDQQLTA
jgi:hypothetical protein